MAYCHDERQGSRRDPNGPCEIMRDMTDTTSVRAGKIIRRRRESLDLPLREVAARTGTAISTIAKIERGERTLTLDMAKRCAKALDLPVQSLAGEKKTLEDIQLLTSKLSDRSELVRVECGELAQEVIGISGDGEVSGEYDLALARLQKAQGLLDEVVQALSGPDHPWAPRQE